jgi:hypothetical protein
MTCCCNPAPYIRRDQSVFMDARFLAAALAWRCALLRITDPVLYGIYSENRLNSFATVLYAGIFLLIAVCGHAEATKHVQLGRVAVLVEPRRRAKRLTERRHMTKYGQLFGAARRFVAARTSG